MKKILAGLLGPLLLSACATLPPADAPLPWDSQVVHGQLPNGLQYRLVRDSSQQQRLDLRLTVLAGSVDEDDDQVGGAHMVEHMTFHSHGGHPEDLRQRMTALGWIQGRHFNAMTSYERTQYLLSPPAGVRQAPQALSALSDLVFALDYDAQDLERERPIVIEEWRGGLGVAQRMNEQRTASQRVGSRYPAHRTIGNEGAIRSAQLAALKRYQARWYVPNNMVLSAVGDFDPQVLAAQIEAAFGHYPRAPLPARDYLELPLAPGLKVFRLQDPQTGTRQVSLLFRLHEPDSRGSSREALRERLIDRMTLAVLQTSLRRQALPDGVRSMVTQKTLIGAHSSVLGIAASVDGPAHAAALRQVLSEVERLRQHGFSDEDLLREREKIRALGEKTLANTTPRTFEQWVEQLNNAAVQGKTVADRHATAARYLEVLDSIGLDTLNARYRRWTASQDQVLQFTAPSAVSVALPTVAEVVALRDSLAQSSLAAPVRQDTEKAAAVVAPLVLPALPPAGTIGTRKPFPAEQVEHWQLSNGDRLVWLRRNGDGGKWLLQAESSAGFNLPDTAAWRLQMAAQLARQSGPAGTSVQALEIWRAQHKVDLSLDQQAQRLALSVSSPPGEGALATMMRSYRLSQVDNVIDPALFEDARADLRKRISERPDNVRERQDSALRQLKHGTDRWQAPTTAALSAVQAQTLEQDWQRLAAAPVTYYLMADVAPAVLENAVREHLANIVRGAALKPQAALQQSGQRRQDLAIALEPRVVLQASSFSPQPWSPQAAARVASLRDLANLQLKQRLRGEASGVYRLKFDSELNADTQRIESSLTFTCDPQRVDELWAMAQDTLAQLGMAVNAEWVNSERNELRRQEILRRDDAQTQWRRLLLSERHWRDPRYLSSQAQLPDALQLDALKATAGRLFPRANQVQLRLLPTPDAEAQAL